MKIAYKFGSLNEFSSIDGSVHQLAEIRPATKKILVIVALIIWTGSNKFL
jgi:hypothetical protein